MADYYPLLERAVSSLPDPTPDARRAIYDRARNALIAQLQNVRPAVPSTYIDRECHALDLAVARLEATILKGPLQPTPAPSEAKPGPRATLQERGRSPSMPLSGVQRTPMNNAARPVARPPAVALSPTSPSAPSVTPPAPLPAQTQGPVKPTAPPSPPSPPPVAIPVADERPEAPEGQLERFGRARADDQDGDSDRREGRRPVAITPSRPPHPMKRIAILGVIVLLAALAVAALAIRLKDNPQDYARSRTPVSTQEADSQETVGKLTDRADSSEPAKPAPTVVAAPAEPVLPVAQRAAILVEAPDDPQKVKTFVGTTLWRLEGSGAASVLVADINLSDASLTATMRMSRNTDPKLPASHTIELRFATGANSEVSSITTIDTPQMRIEESPTGTPLAGAPVPIMPNYFLIGLSNNDKMTVRNMELLRDRSWIDIPMVLNSGRIAKLTFEKGSSGDRAVAQALSSWGP